MPVGRWDIVQAESIQSVTGDGTTVVVRENSAVKVYAKSGSNLLLEDTIDRPIGAHYFGLVTDIADAGQTLVITAYGADSGGVSGAGKAYVYVNSEGAWLLQDILMASDAASGDQFGIAAAISAAGDTVIIGSNSKSDSTGAAYVFTRSGSIWSQEAKLTASDGVTADSFGSAVTLSDDGDIAAISAPGVDGYATNTGAAYVFTRSGGTWSERTKLTASDVALNDAFGTRVELSSSGDKLIVSSAGADSSGGVRNAGAAYVFTGSGASWTEQDKLEVSGAEAGAEYGVGLNFSADDSQILMSGWQDKTGTGTIFAESAGIWSLATVYSYVSAYLDSYLGRVMLGGPSWYLGGATVEDYLPDTIAFTDTSALISSLISSDILQVTGMDDGVATSISGDGSPAYRICDDATCSTDPVFASTASTIDANQYLQLQLTSNATIGQTNSATISIGSFSDIWDVLTTFLTVDLMEYATDLLAQAAYVASGIAEFTAQYPPAYSDTYIKATTYYDNTANPYFATDPAITLTGSWGNNCWLSSIGATTNQRFHIDLGSSKIITKIKYNNYHSGGVNTNAGINNYTLWGSNNAAAFANLTYATDTNWTQITGVSQSTFDQHAASDIADTKYITIDNNTTAYRYYAIKIADNHGHASFLGLRHIELQESRHPLQSSSESTPTLRTEGDYSLKLTAAADALGASVARTLFSGGVYAGQYPPSYSDTYVKATDTFNAYYPYLATNPSLSLTGADDGASWVSNIDASQRFHIDMGEEMVISRIYYENYHLSGTLTTIGVNNFTLWGSNNPSAFAELTYGTDTNWTQITGLSQSTFDQHTSSDVADPKYITITGNDTAYRYYAFKFADNHGFSGYIGLRHVELQELPADERLDLSGKSTIKFDARSDTVGSNLQAKIKDSGYHNDESFINEDFSALGNWIDNDERNGVSTQTTDSGREVFKLDSGAVSGSLNKAYRRQDFGYLDSLGDEFAVEITLNNSAIGTHSNEDYFFLHVKRSDMTFRVYFTSDGLFIHDGSSLNEVGTDIINIGQYDSYRFLVDASDPASATADVWQKVSGGSWVEIATGVDCSYVGAPSSSAVDIVQYGKASSNRISYVDTLKIGSPYQTYTIPISTADTWHELWWDISGVADADKDAIDEIQFMQVGFESDNAYVEDCSSTTGWNLGGNRSDNFDLTTALDTFDSKSVFKFQTGTAVPGEVYVYLMKEFGAVEPIFITEFSVYHSALGTLADEDYFSVGTYTSTNYLSFVIATDGLFAYDGSTFNRVGSYVPQLNTWTTYRLVGNTDTNLASVYVDDVLISDSVNFNTPHVSYPGRIYVQQLGYTTASRLTYLDYIKFGAPQAIPHTTYIDNMRAE